MSERQLAREMKLAAERREAFEADEANVGKLWTGGDGFMIHQSAPGGHRGTQHNAAAAGLPHHHPHAGAQEVEGGRQIGGHGIGKFLVGNLVGGFQEN